MSQNREMAALDANLAARLVEQGTHWCDALTLGIQGQGWRDLEHPYDRLPARARARVSPEIWELSNRSAGLSVRFVTASPQVAAQWTLRRPELAINLMAATGCSGLDLYARHGDTWRFAGVGRPTGVGNECVLITGMSCESREFLLHLPLYNGIDSLRLGVPAGQELKPAAPLALPDPRPICFYGTSINMGGCASRPGMTHIAMLQRRLGRPTLNLGFAGRARCEPELAELFAELDPCLYVIDPLSNMTPELAQERLGPFVAILRRARPNTPILLVGCITYSNGWLHKERGRVQQARSAAMRQTYDQLVSQGMSGLHYLPGEGLLSEDAESTVDGTHPTDLGFAQMAGAMEPALRRLLAMPSR